MNENQRTVTLPTIPREVADAIENFRKSNFSDESIIAVATVSETLRLVPSSTLISALVNGYVIEKTAEDMEREMHDKIRDKYVRFRDRATYLSYSDGVADGIKATLQTLGIKIEGVNA